MYNWYRIYISYSIKKSLSKKQNLLILNKRLEILEETICQTQTADSIEKYTLIKREIRGHGGRVVTLSPPTSEAGVLFPARPQVGKLVVACRWLAVYSTEP